MAVPVGLTVGGWFASTVISKVINELTDYAKDQMKQLGLKDELARLKKTLPKIQAVVTAIDQGLIREENPPLEEWLWQLRDAADRGDDVMDEIKYKYEKKRVKAENNKNNKVITDFKTFFLRVVHKDHFLKRLKDAVKAIDEVAADVGEFYKLAQNLNQKEMVKLIISGRETSSVMSVGTDVFGRELEKEDIIRKLLNPDWKTKKKNLAILPIIGVGGVGKTTLAQLVYNDPTVEKHFKLRLWICISNNFDEVLLTKKLYESALKKRAKLESFDLIQTELSENLKSTRFLVVFDDVWYDNNREGWNRLIAPLTYGESGSMMLLTTRMKSVPTLIGANLMDSIILEGLNKCEMWDLLKECAFGGKNPDDHKGLVEIGRDIVKKLKGSPLAAKTVGGILCSDLNEDHWRSILENDLWSIEQGQNDIMPALRLTYQYLPSHLKPCFSFCSIFPQDHVFRKHDLINMWIALGMVHQSVNGTMRLEDEGSKYFDNMLSKSIFIHSNSAEEFVMHDLIHDLSVFVSKGECLTTITNKWVYVPKTVRHLYALIDAHIDGSLDLINAIPGLKNLRTLILHFDEYDHSNQDSLVAEMLRRMKNLRLLILFADKLREFPENASKLLHLRYLRISSRRISAFPESMASLYLLETMVYNGSDQLKQADVLDKLINLKELTIQSYGDTPIDLRPQAFSKMVRITIYGLNFVHLPSLELLPHLKYIDFWRMNAIESIIHEFNQSSTVDAFPSLEELSLDRMSAIKEWRLTKQPNKWMQCLRKLNVSDCRELQVLPPVPVGVKELRFAKLGLNALPNLWNDQSNKSDLVIINIYLCINLKSLNEGLLQNPERFMALKELSITYCDELMNLPPGGFNKFISLIELDLCFCSNIQVEEQFFLPSTLQKLKVLSCGSLDTTLPKALESVHSLIELDLKHCTNITSLPPKEVFSRWKTLKRLILEDCPALASLESLLGLSSIEYLRVCGCPKLFPVVPSSLPLKEEDEQPQPQPPGPSSTMEIGQTSALKEPLLYVDELDELLSEYFMMLFQESDSVQAQPPSPSSMLEIGQTSALKQLLYSLDLLNKLLLAYLRMLNKFLWAYPRMFMQKLKRSVSAQPQPPSPSSTMETGNTFAQGKPLLSVDELQIDSMLLSVEPMRSLSAVRKLTLFDCFELQSLPELSPSLQELYILQCSPELQKRCEKSGPDWPKLRQIPKVEFEL